MKYLLALMTCCIVSTAPAEEEWHAFRTSIFEVNGVLQPGALDKLVAGTHEGLVKIDRVCWKRDGRITLYKNHGREGHTYGYASVMYLKPDQIISVVPMSAEFNKEAWAAFEKDVTREAEKTESEPMY